MPKPIGTRVVLASGDELGKIHVGLEDFFEFNFWVNEQLTELSEEYRLRWRPAPATATFPLRWR